jgi:2-polyprenyl-6-methoxyphenol hydroxylase-like FAD-dependent oxidoreductase
VTSAKPSRTERRRHAVVIGASVGGLTAARVLSDQFDVVTVLDRDELPADVRPRRGVPQGRQAHALLAGGARAIAELFPGIMDEFVADGAALLDFNDGTWFQAGGYRARSLIERKVISASRPFLEAGIRRRVAALPNVRFETGVAVSGLEADGHRVRGVRVDDGSRVVTADLVVDCSGRGSQAPQWLEQIGFPAPEVVKVGCNVRYATMLLRRRPTDLDGTFAVSIGSPPRGKRAGFLLPIEGDRWIAAIGSSFGAPSATTESEFREIAASLPSPELSDVLAVAEPLTPVATHRMASSLRRRYEKLRRAPAGFVVLGDAVCSFNPVYGQGMTSAVLQAVELGRCVDRHGTGRGLFRAFARAAAEVVDNPWRIAVGADFAYPECTGPKPPGTDLINRYMGRVLLAAQVSPEINTAMIVVQNLLAPPSMLLSPRMIPTVLRAARVAERRQVAAPPTRARIAVPA